MTKPRRTVDDRAVYSLAGARPLSVGALCGLVAGLLLTLAQALARLWIGVSPPAELLGDRVAPLLSIDQFFALLGFFGGYDQLKGFGVVAGTLGQLAVAVVLGIGFARLSARSQRDGSRPAKALAVATAVLWLVAVIVLWPVLPTSQRGLPPTPARIMTMLVMAATLALFAVALVVTFRLVIGRRRAEETPESPPPASVARRALLAGGAGVGFALATGGVGRVLYQRSTFHYDGMEYNGPGIQPITPNPEFYVVTKNVVDPAFRPEVWRLAVGGAVAAQRALTFDDLRRLPSTVQETTLTCISNGIGGGLESNAMWTGVRLPDLLRDAGPADGVVEVLLTGVDGYTDTFSIEKAMQPTTLVAYEMNGEPLPPRHGFPARVIVPGLFGEKNVKWVTRIDLVTEEARGFYERQGWGPNFVVPTRSRFTEPDFSQPLKAGSLVTLRGTGFAGDRGVQQIEVSIDDGATWLQAQLEYASSPLAWVLWRYDWRPERPGEYALLVRATDRTGAVQTPEERPRQPEGATGYHRAMARVEV
ncbi:MAG: molybdopterin-dependent oxidoreductase [Egibacteraceae bacterium]